MRCVLQTFRALNGLDTDTSCTCVGRWCHVILEDEYLLHMPFFYVPICTGKIPFQHGKHESFSVVNPSSPTHTTFLLLPFSWKCCSGCSLRWMSQEISSWPSLIISTLAEAHLTYGSENLITSLKFPGVHLYNLLSKKAWNWNS